MTDDETVTLWRPVGPTELELIRASGMRAFPPRLLEQPIFHPVRSEDFDDSTAAIVGGVEATAEFR